MKLSTVFAKLTCMQSKVVRSVAALALAGALSFAAVPHAKAQHIAFGVQFGTPAYAAPAYVGPGYGYGYAGPRYNGLRQREEWRRQQEWLRFHQPYAYHSRGRDFDEHRGYGDHRGYDDHHARGW